MSKIEKFKVCPNCLNQVSIFEELVGSCENCYLSSHPKNFPFKFVQYEIIKERTKKFLFFSKIKKTYIPLNEFSKQWLVKNSYL